MKAGLSMWSPFRELDRLQDGMRSRSTHSNGDLSPGSGFANWSPVVDIAEVKKEFTITANLPAVKKDEVKVTLYDSPLTIRGEREHKGKTMKKKFHRVERSYGRYLRTFRLPEVVEDEKIDAQFDNGVLPHAPPKGHRATHQAKVIRFTEPRHPPQSDPDRTVSVQLGGPLLIAATLAKKQQSGGHSLSLDIPSHPTGARSSLRAPTSFQ